MTLSAVLPLILENVILNEWSYFASESPDDEKVKKKRSYMIKQWIKPRILDFYKTWSVFDERNRTTNFLEGWHHGLNKAIEKKTQPLIFC